MENEQLKQLVMESQLKKNSCKILHDAVKGGVKSIEVKAYGGYGDNKLQAVEDAVEMLCGAIEKLEEKGFTIEK